MLYTNKTISPYHSSLIFLAVTSFFIVTAGWLSLIFSSLFTLFLLKTFNLKIKNKFLTSILFVSILLSALSFLFIFGSYIVQHFDELFNIESTFVQKVFSFLKIQQPKDFDFNFIFKFALSYIKSNIGLLFSFGANSLQIIVGIFFGFIFFFHKQQKLDLSNYWNDFLNHTSSKLIYFFDAFNSVLKLQLTVSIMNVLSLSVLSFIITPLFTGSVLPYWYILLPLTGILSLIPVIGNIFVNVLIFAISINISVLFMIVSIFYFFIVHKIELLTIGTIIGKKNETPFLYVTLSMLLGELFFHSMLGILFGVITLIFFKNILTDKKQQALS